MRKDEGNGTRKSGDGREEGKRRVSVSGNTTRGGDGGREVWVSVSFDGAEAREGGQSR